MTHTLDCFYQKWQNCSKNKVFLQIGKTRTFLLKLKTPFTTLSQRPIFLWFVPHRMPLTLKIGTAYTRVCFIWEYPPWNDERVDASQVSESYNLRPGVCIAMRCPMFMMSNVNVCRQMLNRHFDDSFIRRYMSLLIRWLDDYQLYNIGKTVSKMVTAYHVCSQFWGWSNTEPTLVPSHNLKLNKLLASDINHKCMSQWTQHSCLLPVHK